MDILLLIVGLAMILIGANFLTDGSAAVAERFRVPEFIIGLTIVAVGTSTPELVVSVLSSIEGNSSIAIGNVIGSNAFNVFVILGICALIRPLRLTASNIRRDIPILMLVSLLLLLFVSDEFLHLADVNHISRWEGIFMLLLYGGVMWYTIKATGHSQAIDATTEEETPKKKPVAVWLAAVMIIGGLFGLIYGGDLFLDHATALAKTLGVSDSVIAITLVAGGTSLPELASSVVSLMKGKSDMALGNVIGSNIANILMILGISSTIRPLTMGGITPVDIMTVVLGSLLLFVSAFTFRKRELDRIEGAIMLLVYVAYIWYLIQ